MNLNELNQIIHAGDVDAVRAALDAQPELLYQSQLEDEHWEERTALHCAAKAANMEIVKLLVERGAEVYSHPHSSYPAVFIADRYRDSPNRPDGKPIIDYFLNEIPHLAAGTLGLGITIHLAARLGFSEIVRKHLERDPLAVHQRGWLGDTALHWACHNGHTEIATMLLDAGADIEADEINCYGGKPLHWASEHEPHIVKLLLDRGANVDSLNNHIDSELCGVTPLLMNAHQRDDCAEVASLLIEAGADLTAQHQGKTAMEIARDKGNQRIVEVLERVASAPNQPSLGTQRISRIPDLPIRPDNAHKGTFGSVLILAGSEGMSGAASLAGRAALHGGAGLVSVAIPRPIAQVVASAHCSYMTIPLEADSEGQVSENAFAQLEKVLERQTVLAIGPGLGQGSGVRTIVQHLVRTCPLPVVVDADGLNAFVGEIEQLTQRNHDGPRVLTPHPGEFSRLTGFDKSTIESNREQLAINFAREHRVVLLLKGKHTVITDGKKLAINRTGCSALATGGSGDVLTGLIAALIAQGMDAFDAAHLGAHVHGLAGELVASKFSDRYATSMELVDQLSDAWLRLGTGQTLNVARSST